MERRIQGAALVVIAAGTSPEVQWELKTAVELVEPKRLILLLPFDESTYGEFRRLTNVLPCSLPPYPDGRPSLKLAVRAAIFFHSDWTPQIVRFDTKAEYAAYGGGLFGFPDMGLLETMISYELAPALDRLSVPRPRPVRRAEYRLSPRQRAKMMRVAMIPGVMFVLFFIALMAYAAWQEIV